MADLTQDEWAEMMRRMPEAIILDVRTDEEVEEGYIPGARQLDIRKPQEFMDAIQALDPERTYLVYCRSGNRSGQACALMQSVGIEEVYNLMGGVLEWEGEWTTEPMA